MSNYVSQDITSATTCCISLFIAIVSSIENIFIHTDKYGELLYDIIEQGCNTTTEKYPNILRDKYCDVLLGEYLRRK
jgi:hypothetical protein